MCYLSIVIPAYNEQKRLPSTIEQISKYLDKQTYTSEVIVIENASTDSTYSIANELSQTFPNLRVIQEPQKGKGNAVRRGMLEARGKYRFMCDADLSMPIGEISKFLPPVCLSPIAIGSREVDGAVRYHEPWYRHVTGRIFNLLVQIFILEGIKDSQCGFKMFFEEMVNDLFQYQTLTGWSFDVEILFIARLRGYTIEEIPINWYYSSESKVRLLNTSYNMFLDLIKIKNNKRKGIYS